MNWLEVRLALFPEADGDGPHVPWPALHEAIRGWSAEERFDRWFFVRKPPGLRVRFGGAEISERLERSLTEWLTQAELRNDIRSFRFATYEAEEYRFGGAAGMDVAHQAVDGQCRVILNYETTASFEDGLRRRDLAGVMIADLLERAVGDRAEAWDVACRLGSGFTTAPTPVAATDDRLLAAVQREPAFLASLLPPARRMVEDACVVNERTTSALRSLVDAGRLQVGTRSWLAALAKFHLNALGLALELDAPHATLSTMMAAFEPDGPA